MSPIVVVAVELLGRLLGLVERRLNRPVSKTFPHDGVSDAEIDRLIKRAKDLPKS